MVIRTASLSQALHKLPYSYTLQVRSGITVTHTCLFTICVAYDSFFWLHTLVSYWSAAPCGWLLWHCISNTLLPIVVAAFAYHTLAHVGHNRMVRNGFYLSRACPRIASLNPSMIWDTLVRIADVAGLEPPLMCSKSNLPVNSRYS